MWDWEEDGNTSLFIHSDRCLVSIVCIWKMEKEREREDGHSIAHSPSNEIIKFIN